MKTVFSRSAGLALAALLLAVGVRPAAAQSSRPIDENGRIYSQPSGRPVVPRPSERDTLAAESRRLEQRKAELQQRYRRIQAAYTDWSARMTDLDAQFRYAEARDKNFFGEAENLTRLPRLRSQRAAMIRELERIREANRSLARDAEQYGNDLVRLNQRINGWNRRTPRTPRYSPDSMAEIEAQARRRGR